jgi:hypothetical protein
MDRISWVLGQVDAYCYVVKRGKLAAWMIVPEEAIAPAIQAIEDEGLHHTLEKAEEYGHGLWIWEKPLAGELIAAEATILEHLPTNVYHWYLGALFGYSTESVEEYLANVKEHRGEEHMICEDCSGGSCGV